VLYTYGDKSPGYCHLSLRDAFWPAPEATILSLSRSSKNKRNEDEVCYSPYEAAQEHERFICPRRGLS